ncbi:hypothetical protein Drorol1_Dr00008943 [Drosera rotundifolia]
MHTSRTTPTFSNQANQWQHKGMKAVVYRGKGMKEMGTEVEAVMRVKDIGERPAIGGCCACHMRVGFVEVWSLLCAFLKVNNNDLMNKDWLGYYKDGLCSST